MTRPDPEFVALLQQVQKILVFTGAGISTTSGIPDYRGPRGVWKTRQPVYYQDFISSEQSRLQYWEQKLLDHEGFAAARPNATHEAVARLEQAGKLLMVVTQNIDGLHQRAGTSLQRLVEVHGTNAQVECQTCGRRSDPGPHFDYFRQHRKLPSCEGGCPGHLKSATISFGQSLREDDLARAARAAGEADLVLAMGSTLAVQPAASIPLEAARRGVPYVIINRGETEHDHLPRVTLRLEGDVSEILPAAVDALLGD